MRARQTAIGALVAAFLSVACAATSVSPAPARPTPSAATSSPSAGDAGSQGTEFASTRYGYRLRHPEGWRVSETPGSGGVHPDEPGVDTFRDRLGHTLSIVGEPVVSGGAWTCAIVRHLEGDEHQLTPDAVEPLTVAGRQATLREHHLEIKPYVIHYLTVQLEAAGRGLTLSLESPTNDDVADRAILDRVLGTLGLAG
jgi:hypothetical protein